MREGCKALVLVADELDNLLFEFDSFTVSMSSRKRRLLLYCSRKKRLSIITQAVSVEQKEPDLRTQEVNKRNAC
jgi:hypothetical protein